MTNCRVGRKLIKSASSICLNSSGTFNNNNSNKTIMKILFLDCKNDQSEPSAAAVCSVKSKGNQQNLVPQKMEDE